MNTSLYPEVFSNLLKEIEPTHHEPILKRQRMRCFMAEGNATQDVIFHKINGLDQGWANSCPGTKLRPSVACQVNALIL